MSLPFIIFNGKMLKFSVKILLLTRFFAYAILWLNKVIYGRYRIFKKCSKSG